MSTNKTNNSLSIANPYPEGLSLIGKIGLSASLVGVLLLFLSFLGMIPSDNDGILLTASIILMMAGTIVFARDLYLHHPEGIKNNGVWFNSLSAKGVIGWGIGVVLTTFYILLYWFPSVLGLGAGGAANTGIVSFFDPLSMAIKGKAASQWFVYGTLYTVSILALGYKFILKYRHNKYQTFRTITVMISQLGLAFLLPEILEALNPEMAYFDKDIKNMWPLNYDFFSSWHMDSMLNGGNLGMFFLIFGVGMFLFISPILTYFYGKRWYCSFVCGCGGLAETAGDSFRHLSDKSLSAWKLERWMIHGVLVLVTIMTAVTLYGYFYNVSEIAGLSIYNYFQKPYGFLIGAAFSGVVGVGFYPILGSRVWCRFGCPMAGLLGLQQKFFSRFRITTNGGQCISCGNCSTYCEMGIDVRAYAQRGQNIVRASCVGCGVCSAVCPRGVLRLENGSVDMSTRTLDLKALHISAEDGVKLK